MTRTKTLAVLGLTALTAIAVIAGTSLLPVLVLVPFAVVAIVIHRDGRPAARGVRSEHWWRWGAAGAALLGTLVVAEGAGPDFDWFPWLGLWLLALTGLVFLAMGFVLGIVHAVTHVRHTTG